MNTALATIFTLTSMMSLDGSIDSSSDKFYFEFQNLNQSFYTTDYYYLPGWKSISIGDSFPCLNSALLTQGKSNFGPDDNTTVSINCKTLGSF